MTTITVVGGGLAGLVAAIECAEAGAEVRVLEAHAQLGGRARTTTHEFHANYGPHVVYDDGALWQWLAGHGIDLRAGRAPLTAKVVFRHRGKARRLPPLALVNGLRRLRRVDAPDDIDFRTWATSHAGAAAAEVLSRAAGVFTFDHDPGRLAASFVAERGHRVVSFPPTARYVPGGWGTMIAALADRARRLGVEIETAAPVADLPPAPVIVATDLAAARRLLGDDALTWSGTRTALLDVGLRSRRGDPFVVSDLDESGWVEMFSKADPTLAPLGADLVQAQMGLRPGETLESGVERIEALLDLGYRGWRDRELWRRRSVIEGRSGALDLPGTTWRDRPAIDRGGGVFLAGDMAAAPGLLGEVAVASAVEAARLAVASAVSSVRARSGRR
jgi:phytoene dehydrogenase-like protein